MIKKPITIGMVLLVGLLFAGEDTQTLFREATNYYNDSRFEKAIENYEKILDKGLHSTALYYNLANSYYKSNKIAPSIYYYNKALMLSPNDSDIKSNLFFAQAKVLDTIEPLPQTFFSKVIDVLTYFKFDTWAVLAIFFFTMFNAFLIMYYISKRTSYKRVFFGISIFAFIMTLFTLNNAYYKYGIHNNTKYAIVFSDVITVKSEPNMSGEGIFQLHEGTKVQVLESLDEWSKIKLTNGKIGWMPSSDVRPL